MRVNTADALFQKAMNNPNASAITRYLQALMSQRSATH
jgi:hypothetical protein